MTVWTNQKGTQTAVISTEHTLAQNSNANTFQFSVDMTNMANGDITELRVYRIVNASAIQIANGIYANIQANPLKEYRFTASQGVANGIKVTLKQTGGTGRNFDWELLADNGGLTITTNNDKTGYALSSAGNNAIATAIWTDTTAGDFTTATSPGKIIFTQLGGAFTTTSSSVFTTASLANGPSGGGGGPTAAAIATAVWQDLTASSDFTTAGSIGKLLVTAVPNAVAGAAGGLFIAGTNAATTITTGLTANITGNVTGNLSGSVGSVTAGVTVSTNGDKTGYTLGSTGNNNVATAVLTNTMIESYSTQGASFTLAQGVYGITQQLGQMSISGTTMTVKKRDASTTAKTYTLDSATTPTSIVEAS